MDGPHANNQTIAKPQSFIHLENLYSAP